MIELTMQARWFLACFDVLALIKRRLSLFIKVG